MKLLCAVPSYWPSFQLGGPIHSIHGLNKELVKKGIDVTVFSTNAGLNKEVPVNQETDVDGVKVTYFRFVKLFEFMGRTDWQFSWEMTNALRTKLKTFDLIHINGIWNYPVAAAAFYCRQYRKPYIITPRGVLYPYTIGKKAWKKRPYYNLIAKKDLNSAAAIHYTTEDEARKTHSFLGLKNKTFIVPNGIDLSEFNVISAKGNSRNHYPVLNDKKVILFLGRINWKKGMDILAKAFGNLARCKNDVHLLIVGNNEDGYQKKVEKWLKDENVLDKATFTGMLTGKERIEAYAGSDMLVLPSYSENFGMVVAEAMACGLPVVISNQVGIYKEVAEAKAGIVVETNPIQLAEAMKNLLDDSAACKKMGENGERLVKEKFTLDKVAEQMIAVYREILNHQ